MKLMDIVPHGCRAQENVQPVIKVILLIQPIRGNVF